MFGGMNRLKTSVTAPTRSMMRRLNRSMARSSRVARGTTSLLALNPTRDRKVVAEDSAAAITPVSNKAPIAFGIMFIAAQIMVSS